MMSLLKQAGFTDIQIQVKENGREIISGWMPGSGAEKYVTSAYVTATKPMDGAGMRDSVRPQTNGNMALYVKDLETAAPAAGC